MLGLIADIGGTNARFALVDPASREALHPLVLACADFAGPTEAALAYLARIGPAEMPRRGAFAVASPVVGDSVEMTNHLWSFSISETRRQLNFDDLYLVNDFAAVALSAPLLGDTDQVAVGGGTAEPDAPIAVLGPGTGLGVSALVPTSAGWHPIATEGGHITMPPANDHEARVLDWLRAHHGHVSAERVLSGPGMINLYLALAGLAGRPGEVLTPSELTGRAASGDLLAAEALSMFFAMLGTVAGNLALTLGARGGVMIAGGIIPRFLPAFLASDFRQRFEDKGRLRSYLAPIPVHAITHPYPAFLGLAGLVLG